MKFHALSGRPLEEITLAEATAGNLKPTDLRIHPETLRYQADIAEKNGNPQLAENLRRAVELTAIDDAELLCIYEALRPGRATLEELEAIASKLASAGARCCAAFVREAAEVYSRRGLAGDAGGGA